MGSPVGMTAFDTSYTGGFSKLKLRSRFINRPKSLARDADGWPRTANGPMTAIRAVLKYILKFRVRGKVAVVGANSGSVEEAESSVTLTVSFDVTKV